MKYNHQKLYEEIIKLSLYNKKILAFIETQKRKIKIKPFTVLSYVRIIEKWGLSHFKKNSIILDIGAGGGRISLYLQQNRYKVIALEKSKYLCKVIRQRGVKRVVNEDIFNYYPQKKFKQILLLNSHPFDIYLSSVEKFFNHVSCHVVSGKGKIMLFFSKTRERKNDKAKRRYVVDNKIGEWKESIYPSVDCFVEIAGKYGFKKVLFDIDHMSGRYFIIFKKVN